MHSEASRCLPRAEPYLRRLHGDLLPVEVEAAAGGRAAAALGPTSRLREPEVQRGLRCHTEGLGFAPLGPLQVQGGVVQVEL